MAAKELDDNVPLPEKKERLNVAEQLQERIATEINSRLLGKIVEILVEGKEKGRWRGRTRTDKLVFFSSASDCQGQLMKIKINKTGPWSLQGEVEPYNIN